MLDIMKGIRRHLDHLESLPFVRGVTVRLQAGRDKERRPGATIRIRTPAGGFSVALETKTSYLDAVMTNAIIARAKHRQAAGVPGVILFAPYVPLPTAEALAAAGVNFVDAAGNVSLRLGNHYHALVMGKPLRLPRSRALSRAEVQVLFTLACRPESAGWPVRLLAQAAGVGKSVAANIRHFFAEEGLLIGRDAKFRLEGGDLSERLLLGYSRVLRPRLLLNRFRSAEAQAQRFVSRLPAALRGTNCRWALTGSAAAYALRRFYRGPDVALFVSELDSDLQQRLRILPDKKGPIWMFHAFGDVVFWRTARSLSLAHPWLIYCELMNSADPRAHEAAETIRREFLVS